MRHGAREIPMADGLRKNATFFPRICSVVSHLSRFRACAVVWRSSLTAYGNFTNRSRGTPRSTCHCSTLSVTTSSHSIIPIHAFVSIFAARGGAHKAASESCRARPQEPIRLWVGTPPPPLPSLHTTPHIPTSCEFAITSESACTDVLLSIQ